MYVLANLHPQITKNLKFLPPLFSLLLVIRIERFICQCSLFSDSKIKPFDIFFNVLAVSSLLPLLDSKGFKVSLFF